jgi:hypothetical protein
VVARLWPGGEKRIGGRALYHEESEVIGSFLLPYAATGGSLLTVGSRSSATPRGQPWTPAVTRPQGCDGLRARRTAVVWTFRKPSLGRHVRHGFMRNAVLDLPLLYLQLLATKAMTSRQTGGLRTAGGTLRYGEPH